MSSRFPDKLQIRFCGLELFFNSILAHVAPIEKKNRGEENN